MSIYDINVNDINGNNVSLSEFKDKVLLIVNTATSCGLTPQYSKLQELHNKYFEKGLIIMDFPCNQFNNQAKQDNLGIKKFCEGRFGITFLQFEKIEVNGKNSSELFKYLKKEKSGLLNPDIKWNFTKFLVDRNGNVVKRFSPIDDYKLIEDLIVKLL